MLTELYIYSKACLLAALKMRIRLPRAYLDQPLLTRVSNI
jgi:hypothetical protein